MLRDEARTSGVLSDFALKLEMVLVQWQAEPDRLRWHLRRQAEIVARRRAAGPPARRAERRARRLRQNRIRNEQRATSTRSGDGGPYRVQAQGGAGEASQANSAP